MHTESTYTTAFDSIHDASAAIRRGGMIIVADNAHRENEGDLVMAADRVTPQAINFMAMHGRGLICVPMTGNRLDALRIPLMTAQNTEAMRTAFTVSVDAKTATTGISAQERALTVRTLVDPESRPDDLVQPGHIFPLRAVEHGVLQRPGHTEAAVDLARLAGLYPAGILCEIMNEDGTMARVPQLQKIAATHGLPMITVADLVQQRLQTERLVRLQAETILPTRYGEFRVLAFDTPWQGETHLALVRGEIKAGSDVLVRVHSECLTGDALGSHRCDCGEQLDMALRRIASEEVGALIYMRQEGRGIGLLNKIRAYHLQDLGQDTVEANVSLGFPPDARDYGIAAQILKELGLNSIRLLTNNPGKIAGLEKYGLSVTERIPLEVQPRVSNQRYLQTKQVKLDHWIS